ncbi:MAG: hypothetical protein AUK33_01115 [Flavobacteriaceae bacterium CG2_30_34_30]|nr:MAG: hypothetical protein AUK33_01115 [Flavobacteriaceae bacterium CG2_30_34_30]
MNIRQFLISFENEITEIKLRESNQKTQALETINYCEAQLISLKAHILSNGFQAPDDEIHFFKHIKPIVLSEHIYCEEVLKYIFRFPSIDTETQRVFILKQIRTKEKFILKHQDLLIYLDSGCTTSDNLFFLRENKTFAMMLNGTSKFMDPGFITNKDVILAKLLAYKKFKNHLHNEYYKITKLDKYQHQDNNIPTLKWTASKTDLVELAYALHTSKAFNNGNSDIKQITTAFENYFNTELGDVYKTFSELKYRQKSQTKFLDDIKANLKEFINKSFR